MQPWNLCYIKLAANLDVILNTQRSDLESDALPLRHEVTYSSVFEWRFPCYYTVMNKKMGRDVYQGLKRLVISDLQPEQLMR